MVATSLTTTNRFRRVAAVIDPDSKAKAPKGGVSGYADAADATNGVVGVSYDDPVSNGYPSGLQQCCFGGAAVTTVNIDNI